MFQAIACRDDKKGYYISKSNLPQELSDDTIVFMPELSTKHKDHIKYVSKYTHTSGNIIVKLVRSDGFDPFGRPKALSHSLIIPSEEYTFNNLCFYSSPLFHTEIFDKIESEHVMLNEKYSFSKEQNRSDSVAIKNKQAKITSIAREEKEYLNDYIEMILKEDHEALLEEKAKWVIGMHINSHKELQKLFTKRYELDIPFSRRNKFQASLSKYMERLLHE